MTRAELFQQVDADKDGRVGYGEFSRSVYHSPKHGPDHFRKADQDSDGVLDPNEFVEAVSKVSWWKLSRKTPDDWFILVDSNRDRAIDLKEFARICTSGNHIENIFRRTDRDKSGHLSPRQTTAYIRSITHGKQRNGKNGIRDRNKKLRDPP